MLKSLIVSLLLLLSLASPVAAAAGVTRAAAGELFGQYRLVQDRAGIMWTRHEWDSRPAGAPPAAEYCYLTAAGDRTAAVWLEYDRHDITRRATVILDGTITFRDLGRYFPAL